MDDTVRVAHENLAAISLRDVEKRMTRQWYPNSAIGSAGYVDLNPDENYDPTTAVAVPFPFGNGWAPHMAIRAFMLQDSLDEPTRLILFPNDTTSYDLSKQELAQVKGGDFDPIAQAQLAALTNLRLEKVHYLGYSQGATVGAAALKLAARSSRFELGNSGLFEPPNILPVSSGKLRQAFMKSGKGLSKAVNDSAIPALSEAQHTRGLKDVLGMGAGLIRVAINSQSARSKAIHKGFTHGTFIDDIETAVVFDENLHMTIGAAANSLITTSAALDEIAKTAKTFPRINIVTTENYGHELADNVVAHAILGKRAIKR